MLQSDKRKHEWTLVHSFYAAMGGFVLEVDTSLIPAAAPAPQSSSYRTRFILTAQGVCFLMKHAPELVPDLSAISIRNRCQSDALTKALLVVQLLYFCISCALRLAQALPLSLLEISTFVHAVCAVATYAVWWKKPFNVAEPTVITGEGIEEFAAYLLMASRWTTFRYAGLVQLSSPSELSSLDVFPRTGAMPASSGDHPLRYCLLLKMIEDILAKSL
ncbi:uncharacterized protein PHACADRAFT_257318 [Phanerochaete carnosa HHB-10118-sp]|uniref:Uncharacterized protein n=1 Tax=Phanerochaete carnosa (strain HHB-10118-sp) TaxID=650164 RepID=K5WAH1_PHACS|nr:uncharacterized protein PHACADRAFT_257318 [Phanerochaete carnosa HHB-10118-sp]EKM56215.1 hypothetical protein PHACADRAFT_257318 [Phanerochaete carnosa HHB-10118-sp]